LLCSARGNEAKSRFVHLFLGLLDWNTDGQIQIPWVRWSKSYEALVQLRMKGGTAESQSSEVQSIHEGYAFCKQFLRKSRERRCTVWAPTVVLHLAW
jgi:hypothetical protein